MTVAERAAAARVRTGQPVAPADITQAEPEQERPDQVELLLYRQGPKVVEGRRRPEPGEIGGLAKMFHQLLT
jgi:hypothetical protein